MKSITLTLLSLFVFSQTAFAQGSNTAQATLDMGAGFSKNAWAPSVLYHEDIPLNRVKWLRVGLGIRAWGYYGNDLNLVSQAASSSANTLEYKKVSANGLSFVAGASVKVWKLDIGANTDLMGLALGSRRSGYYPSEAGSSGTGRKYYDQLVVTRPVNFNLLPLFLDNYGGQSEIYARLWFTRSMALKVGYQFGQIAYLTRNIEGEKVFLDGRERRFSSRYSMPYVAISFQLFQ